MVEYCSVTYAWRGRGWTQEIKWLHTTEGQELPEWKGKRWIDYLNQAAREGWELVTITPLGGGEGQVYGGVAYFKRVV